MKGENILVAEDDININNLLKPLSVRDIFMITDKNEVLKIMKSMEDKIRDEEILF